MATLYTNVTTLQDDQSGAIYKRAEAKDASTAISLATATYAIVGTEAINDVINIVKLPTGAIVVPYLCKVFCDDPGTQLDIEIGDDDATTATDPNRYSTTLVLDAGGLFDLTGGVAFTTPYALQATSNITATITMSSTLTAAADVTFYIAYTVAAGG